jgi:hypothetical protein
VKAIEEENATGVEVGILLKMLKNDLKLKSNLKKKLLES